MATRRRAAGSAARAGPAGSPQRLRLAFRLSWQVVLVMCLIVFAWRPGHALPLVVAANRDEFFDRPTGPLTPWPEVPGLLAGRDLQAGGTWLGIGRDGRFAALTNVREGHPAKGRRSRGELTVDFLRATRSPRAYLAEVATRLDAYAPFNLLVGDHAQLWHFNSQERDIRELPEGVYGLSNASLDTPWPKLRLARAALQATLAAPAPEAWLAVLADRRRAADAELPHTGVPLAWERQLSSVFIEGREYGTRSSTVLYRRADGGGEIVERRFGPLGVPEGETRLPLSGRACSAG